MKIRVLSTEGWSVEARQAVIEACQTHGLTFIDRASVCDPQMGVSCAVGADVTSTCNQTSYVFFTHRGMPDLPFDTTIHL